MTSKWFDEVILNLTIGRSSILIHNLIFSPNHRFTNMKKNLGVKECQDIVHDLKFWISLKYHWNPWEKKKTFYFFSGENKIKQEIANINFLLYTWIYKKGGVGVIRIF